MSNINWYIIGSILMTCLIVSTFYHLIAFYGFIMWEFNISLNNVKRINLTIALKY